MKCTLLLTWLTLFVCSRQLVTQVPRVLTRPPDSVPAAVWDSVHAPKNMIQSAPQWGVPFPRDLIVVAFKEEATQAERQQAIDAINGRVIGGDHVDRGGYYYVRIRADGTADALFRAIALLQRYPQVEIASPEPPELSPQGTTRLPWTADSIIHLFHDEMSEAHYAFRAVVQDSARFARFWALVVPRSRGPAPTVDFGRYTVIVATMGQQGSTFRSITVVALHSRRPGVTTVRIALRVKGGTVGWALTYPADIVRVPKIRGTVAFIDQYIVHE